MLKIDCLLLNTEVAETVKQIVGYLGHKGIAEGKDVSFRSMFNELRKNGVEIDAESAARIYEEVLPLEDGRFTSASDLEFDTSRWYDRIVRGITLQEPKKGEKKISELSPSQAVVKGLADAFAHNVSGDETTKSILKQFEDFYRSASQRLLGELPNDKTQNDNRSTAEIIQGALEMENTGYRNQTDGTLNNIVKMHNDVRRQIADLTKEMEATGDYDKIEQWNNYAKSLEDATYTLMFTSAEAKAIQLSALRDGGFTKMSKSGKHIADWEKLAGTVNSYSQLRENLVNSLEGYGFSKEIANRVADSMKKEFRDIRGKILESAEKEQTRLKETWDPANNSNPKAPKDVVSERISRWENYKLLAEDNTKPLTFAKSEANRIVSEAIKAAGFTKEVNGKDVIDWEKFAKNSRSQKAVEAIVKDAMENQGYDSTMAKEVSDSIAEMSGEYFGKLAEYVKAREAKTEDTWLAKNGTGKPQISIKDMIEKRLDESFQLSEIAGETSEHMSLKMHEAQRVLAEALKASEYGRDAVNGKQVDWIKLAELPPSEAQLQDMVKEFLKSEGVGAYNSDLISSTIKEVYKTLDADIKAHAQKTLDARQFALDREAPRRKTDLHRLAELHDLGVFDGAHDRLLSHVLGIDASDAQAVRQIKVFAEKLSKFRKIMQGNDFIAPSIVHSLNREIYNIIAPVIENRSKAMKVVSVINKMYQLENSLLISTHGNILENHLSGAIELLTTNLSQRLRLGKELGGLKKQDLDLMKDMYSHIAKGGNEFGLAPHQVGGSKQRLTDVYNIHKMKGVDFKNPKNWGKALATAVLTLPRTFLSGADGAFKVGLMNAHMKSAVVDAIMNKSNGTIDLEQAVELYNDAIYGPGQLEAALQKAEKIYQSIGLGHVSRKELNITANELLRENLIQNRVLEAAELEAAMENSFREAGLGMGHESNNIISEKQQAWKNQINRKEAIAIRENDYAKAAKLRLTNTLFNDVVFRFAASRFNWAWIRAQQGGAGILTGIYHYKQNGTKFKNIDLITDPKERFEKMNERSVENQAARQKMARGLVGLGINMASYMAIQAIASSIGSDEEGDPLEAMYENLGDNYAAKSLFLKVMPIWLLQSYRYNEGDNGDDIDRINAAMLENFSSLTGVGDKHDFSVRMFEGIDKISKGKSEKQRQRGYVELGKAFGNFVPHTPLLRQGKQVSEFVNWTMGGEPKPMPPFPQNFIQGALYGGLFQDILSTVPEDELPEMFADWGKPTEPSK